MNRRSAWIAPLALASASCASTPAPMPGESPATSLADAPPAQPHGDHEAGGSSASPQASTVPEVPASPPPLAEHAAYERARPVFERFCSSCHTASGSGSGKAALKHFSMDAYPFGGHHAAEMTATIRKVLGASGAPPTMPRDRPGAVTGEDLALVLAWADAADRSAPAPTDGNPVKHGDLGHEH